MTRIGQENEYSVIDNIINEASNYESFTDLEKLVDKEVNLKFLPVQPLYIALKDIGSEAVAESLPLFDKTQRQAFLDLDLWEKDDIDVNSFAFWIKAYALCEDDKVLAEFVTSSEFLLYLKSAFNIWTFDVDDPEYPEHDHYFLSEDQLLLFEYHKDYPFVDEIKSFIKLMYAEMGAEKAYVNLFKIVSESYLQFQEEEFQFKKSRLEEFGLVDYYDSLQTENCFSNIQTLQNYLKNKKRFKTPEIDEIGKNQGLHAYTVAAFRGKLTPLTSDLVKVKEQKRRDFLQFNFVKLVNSRLSFHNALKEGRTSMTGATRQVAELLLLGFDYVTNENSNQQQAQFETFDFFDLYKIGHTLITLLQKEVKKSLRTNHLEELDHQSFLGLYFTEVLDCLFDDPVKVPTFKAGERNKNVSSLQDFNLIKKYCDDFISLLPFIVKMRELFVTLKKEGKIHNDFYYNMKIEDIDFESLILSSFALFTLARNDKNFSKKLEREHKLGLTIAEFRQFVDYISKGSVDEDAALFAKSYGPNPQVFVPYLKTVLSLHLEGHDWRELSDSDLKHVGGPIILAATR